MKEKYQLHRYWTLILIFLAAAGMLWVWLLVPGKGAESAKAVQNGSLPPNWHSFRLTDEPVSGMFWEGNILDVYDHYILWSEGDIHPITGGTPSCENSNSTLYSSEKTWFHMPSGRSDYDICVYDRSTGLVSHLIDSDEGDRSPAMDGDWIAFQREMINAPHLVLYNIVSGHEMLITDTLYTGASDPAIHGDWVVYSNPFDGQIRAYKLSTQEILELSSPSIYFHINPDIYQQIVVWQQVDFQDYSVDIVGYDLSNNTPFTISAQIGNEGNPKVYEDIVVWDWNGDIYSYNLATSQYMTLTNDPFPQMTPDIYENLIVWRDGRHNRWDIYGIDLQTNEVFSVTQGINPVPDTYSPDIWGNIVAWHGPGNQGAAAAIKMTEFSFLPLLNNP